MCKKDKQKQGQEQEEVDFTPEESEPTKKEGELSPRERQVENMKWKGGKRIPVWS